MIQSILINKISGKCKDVCRCLKEFVGICRNALKLVKNSSELYIIKQKRKIKKMNGTAQTHYSNNISVFLFGVILNLLAVIDYSSLIDYSVKAIVGGLIWLAFKIIGEYLTVRMNKKAKEGEGK
jgi:hypothetical protein